MILKFIFSNINIIYLIISVLLLITVALRYFYPNWFIKISFYKLILITIGIQIIYGLFITWGQYYVWINGTEITKFLLNSPLSSSVPFPVYLEWIRPFFSNHNFGYFLYYVFGRYWLSIFISLFLSGILYSIFALWQHYKGGFGEDGTKLFLILTLISGWPGILILIPLGFIFSILFGIYSYFKGKNRIEIEPAFILATLIVLLFKNIIFDYIFLFLK